MTRPKQSQNERVKIADWGKGGFGRVGYIPILSYLDDSSIRSVTDNEKDPEKIVDDSESYSLMKTIPDILTLIGETWQRTVEQKPI